LGRIVGDGHCRAGTTAPEESVTVPVMVALAESWQTRPNVAGEDNQG